MSVTLTSVVTSALQFLGILDSGGSPSTQQLADALLAVNNLIDSKSQDRLMAESVLRTTQSLTGGTQSYTIGTGGTVNIARPAAIEAAAILITSGPTMPIKVLNAKEWTNIPDRDSSSYWVKFLFYDRANAAGLGKFYLSPTPLGGTIELLTWSAMTQFADATTPITVNPGYERWLILATAIEIAGQYPAAILGPSIQAAYADATATLRNLNASLLGGEPPAGQVTSPAPGGGVAVPGQLS